MKKRGRPTERTTKQMCLWLSGGLEKFKEMEK